MTRSLPLLPDSASSFAPSVDAITVALIGICGLIALTVFTLILFFGIRYRKGSSSSRAISERGSSLLEWSWTLMTFSVFVGLFIWGAIVYFRMHAPPENAMEVSVVGKQWMWSFQHSEGRRELNELHLPVNRPVLLTLASEDVIHSFFIPAFRIKQDAVPGRYTYLWFQATKTGSFHLFCTQYCGTSHAEMRGEIIVQSEADYENWLSGSQVGQLKAVLPAERGELLYRQLGCVGCHDRDIPRSQRIGPILDGIYGKNAVLANGQTVLVDENYLHDCILEPGSRRLKEYPPVMPSFRGQVKEEELLDLIAYIKSLPGDAGSGDGDSR
jgi:cytochrome c oxidase subunit 2